MQTNGYLSNQDCSVPSAVVQIATKIVEIEVQLSKIASLIKVIMQRAVQIAPKLALPLESITCRVVQQSTSQIMITSNSRCAKTAVW